MRRTVSIVLLLAITSSLGACACRPGRISPYGVRPARCWVW